MNTPKLPPLPMRQIAFSAPDALLDRLDAAAVQSNVPRAQINSEAIELFCDFSDSPVEAFGLILEGFESVIAAASADEIGEPKGTA